MMHLLHKKYSAIRLLFQYNFFINIITVVLSTMQFKNINNFAANAFFFSYFQNKQYLQCVQHFFVSYKSRLSNEPIFFSKSSSSYVKPIIDLVSLIFINKLVSIIACCQVNLREATNVVFFDC